MFINSIAYLYLDTIVANKGRVVAAISIHSYSQLWMSPYGYSSTLPADYTEMVTNLAYNWYVWEI